MLRRTMSPASRRASPAGGSGSGGRGRPAVAAQLAYLGGRSTNVRSSTNGRGVLRVAGQSVRVSTATRTWAWQGSSGSSPGRNHSARTPSQASVARMPVSGQMRTRRAPRGGGKARPRGRRPRRDGVRRGPSARARPPSDSRSGGSSGGSRGRRPTPPRSSASSTPRPTRRRRGCSSSWPCHCRSSWKRPSLARTA